MSSCSLNSLRSDNDNSSYINKSVNSIKDGRKRELSASSEKSKDSGVCDDNFDSKDSRLSSASSKPPSAASSGKRSSARKKLLRIDDSVMDDTTQIDLSDQAGVNMTSRSKSRMGNVAFDIVLDMPETGNLKKRPEKLARIEQKRRRSTKKLKTKEELDRKIHEADERRKNQEIEKQMKAKQFQHLSINTTVQPFEAPSDDEEDVNNNSIIKEQVSLNQLQS